MRIIADFGLKSLAVDLLFCLDLCEWDTLLRLSNNESTTPSLLGVAKRRSNPKKIKDKTYRHTEHNAV